nr:hypothetical protein [Tanacetum cinerariifolium]
MCDKKNSVFFTDTECVVLSSDFKLSDENHVLLKVLRENNMYNVDLKNIVPSGDLTCLFAKATLDESNLWHRRLGHINFKTMNKLLEDYHQIFLKINILVLLVRRASNIEPIVLVTKPHNKTPYELLLGKTHSIGFMRPFGCPVTILNTLDLLEKFDGKANEEFLVGYSVSSKAFRVFNSRTRIIQETLHIIFLENQPNVAGSGPTWLFDIDTLTQYMNYQPVVAGNQPNSSAGIQENLDAGKEGKEPVSTQQYVLLPLWSAGFKDPQNSDVDAAFADKENENEVHVSPLMTRQRNMMKRQKEKLKKIVMINTASAPVTAVGPYSTNSTNSFNVAGPYDNVVSPNFKIGEKSSFVDPFQYPDDPNMPTLEDIIYSDDEEDVGAEADFSNLETSINVSPIPTARVHKDHLVTQIIGNLSSAPQTRKEPKRVHQLLKDSSWIEALQEELLQFKMQKEEGIDYEEVFAPVARIEAIWLFLAYASFMGFMVYQMDVKSAFLYGTIEEEVYVYQPPRFEDPDYLDKVYKVVKALYGLHQAPRAWYLKGKPHLGLWYPKDSPFNLVAYSDSDYVGASLDRKSTTEGCQFLGCRLIFWQCKKQTVVATSSTEAEYVAVVLKLIITTVSSKLMLFGLTIDVAHLMLLGHQCMSAKRTAWNGFSSSMASAVICLATVDNLSSHNTKYTSSALTQKVFANMRRIGKGFSGMDTPLFDGMLVQQQVQDVEDAAENEDDDHEVPAAPTPPSPTPITPPPSATQEHLPSPPEAQTAQPSSSPPQQPSQTADISMTLLNTLLETCVTLTKQVANLEQDKIAQAIEITKLKQRVKRLEKKRKFKSLGLKRLRKDFTLENVDADVKVDADVQGRLAESQEKVYHLDLQHAKKFLSMQDTDEAEPAEVEEVNEVVTAVKLMTKVVTTAPTTITAAQVPKASAPRRRRGVIIQDPEETATASVIVHYEVKSKDKEEEVISQKEEEGSKRKGENLNQDTAKKQRIDEETKELKTHLQIVANDDDDVYTEATPLASKVPVVDY